eukprot:gnl/TRDRNA2_/TRDRNA2_181472_c0_seq1.p1 gnl/TRDRNA2_/TRDRNA2_181472_c0~~gnl/TRDRNA2_/TRDRNA2_181472_c0_seq1.p1  ORF type:complete len:238 (+),score=39.82 gnl/TRDRNA2_/TRDRNA2_181472_c0_seq1:781-1494(+)
MPAASCETGGPVLPSAIEPSLCHEIEAEAAPCAKRHRSDNASVTPMFLAHVADTCMQKFSPTYFATGIAEECAELGLELTDLERVPSADTYGRAVSEAGDVLWYVVALCRALPFDDGSPVLQWFQGDGDGPVGAKVTESDFFVALNLQQLYSAMGALCGSVKKFSRGDKPWADFRDRIAGNVHQLLSMLQLFLERARCRVKPTGDVTNVLEAAMKVNIDKIQSRKIAGKLQGDGEKR